MSETIYSPEWHEWHKWTNAWSTRALFGVFAHLGTPSSLLDVGCADGHLVKVAAALGVRPAVGIDIAVKPEIGHNYMLTQQDLSDAFDLGRFHFVLSWEVAEHLPAKSADVFCDSLAAAVLPTGHLVFTAATPGQGGHGHIHEMPAEYWREKLLARGLMYLSDPTEALRSTWRLTNGPCWWYGNNAQVFQR